MLLRKQRPNRTKEPQPYVPPVRIVSASVDLAVLTVEFDQPIRLKSVPPYGIDVASAEPLSATVINATTIEITYSASIALGTTLTIPYQSGSVRGDRGGYVADSVFTFA